MSADLNIVVVEDNDLIREEMVCFLTRPGWHAYGADCGEQLNQLLAEMEPDIAVLDVNLPYEDGYSIAARLRETHPDIGIIMLTARVRPVDRSEGYQSGADVYLTKPTNTDELISVIQNMTRRLRPLAVRQLRLDRKRGLLIGLTEDHCKLTVTELRILELLALAPGREADAEFLLAELEMTEARTISRENLSVMISRLRSKCLQLQGVENLLVSHRGQGYRLALPITLTDV